MLAKITCSVVGASGWLGLVKVAFDPDGRTADFRFMLLAMAIVATIHLLLRCYVTPGREKFEAGRIQGRREVIAEMNGMTRKASPEPIHLAEHRPVRRRAGVRV